VGEVLFITDALVKDRLKEITSVNPKTRVQDLKANDIRGEHIRLSNRDPDSILVEMNTQLMSWVPNNAEDVARGFELFQKTNQFNVTLARTIQPEFSELHAQNQWLVVTQLSDRYSESGIIASVLFELNNRDLEIREFCISCRAIGRNIEKYILANMIEKMTPLVEFETVSVELNVGPRNVPAADFCKHNLPQKQDNLYSFKKRELLNPIEQVTLSKIR